MGSLCRPLQDILFGASSTPCDDQCSILCRHNPSILQPKGSIKWQLPRASGSRAYATAAQLVGDSASDATTGAKESRRQKDSAMRKERICTSHIGVMAAVLYLYVCTRRGDTEVCAVPKHHKNYILPTMLPPPSWLRAAGPPPQARHLTGRIDKRYNFGDPATVEWQRGEISHRAECPVEA